MENITAAKFYNLFIENCKEDRFFGDKSLMSLYTSNTEYTDTVNKKIIKNIVETFGLTPQFEYFRIDVIGWESRWGEICEKAKALEMNPHLWDLKIAVEHENDKKDWYDEVIKLVHIRCPLKVIIGGLLLRLKSCKQRLMDYCDNKLNVIDELEETLLPYDNNSLNWNKYVDLVSPCDI